MWLVGSAFYLKEPIPHGLAVGPNIQTPAGWGLNCEQKPWKLVKFILPA